MHKHQVNTFSENEFRELYLEYYPILYRIAVYVLKEESAAEDIVQDIFLKLWKHPSILSKADSIKAYLISMAKNSTIDHLKKIKKERDQVLQLEYTGDNEELKQDDEFNKALEIAVSKLPPKCRLIFSLSRFEGLSNDEIAEYLQISKRTVETQISIALKAFRHDLRPIFEAHLALAGLTAITFLLQQI